jgi:hypothetical protein|tara:strand:+ start:377 stop:550 length:174 start_codon:yes stop_codon:yes gene_type:complete
LIYTPKEAHSRIFVTGQYSRDKCWPKEKAFLGAAGCKAGGTTILFAYVCSIKSTGVE